MYRYVWVIKLLHWIGCLILVGYEVVSVYHFSIGKHYYVGDIDFTVIRIAAKLFIIVFAILLSLRLNPQNAPKTHTKKRTSSHLLGVTATICYSTIALSGFFFPPLFYVCLLLFYFMIIVSYSLFFSIFCILFSCIQLSVISLLRGDYFGIFNAVYFASLVLLFKIVFWLFLKEWRKESKQFSLARKAASEYARINTRLQDDINITETTARNEERIRVARQVHDTIGYTLTAVLVQLAAAEEEINQNPEMLRKRIDTLDRMTRSAVQEVRATVSELRDIKHSNDDWRTRWLTLGAIFVDTTGIKVHFDIGKKFKCIGEKAGERIYRIMQEAITNAYRHGNASFIDISMGLSPSGTEVRLRISDDGMGADKPEEGNGLMGVRERVKELNGVLAWQTLPNKGFDIGIVFPRKDILDENKSTHS